MLRNYLLVSIRNIKKHFSYSFVNIFGLTIGLACTLVIGIWVHQEYSFDKHFKDSDKIFRIGVNFFNIGNMAIGPEILKEKLLIYPDVAYHASMGSRGSVTFATDKAEISIEKCFTADKDFFKVFSYEFLQGNPKTALDEPNTIVLTVSTARKLFGSADAIGNILHIKDDPQTYTVTGVVKESGRSHISANMWFSFRQPVNLQWTSASSYQYVKMKKSNGEDRLSKILDEQQKEVREKFAPDQTVEEFKASGLYQFLPIALEDIHLKSELKFEPSPTGNLQTTNVFAGVAILILLLASVNFINISTARATTRAKEVGVRKSLGTRRTELVFQFTLESVLVCLIAGILALVIGELFLFAFEKITGLELLETLFNDAFQLIIVLAGAILLGILAGVYPAVYITRFKAVNVLKGKLGTGEKGILRNGLVLFQFTISICLLIIAIFIYNQLRYIETRDMGFDMKNVLVIDNIRELPDHGKILKQELEKKSYVEKVSINDRVPASSNTLSITSVKNDEEKEVFIQQFSGDEDMMECLGFRLIAGREFSKSRASDTAALIINEAALTELELEDPIGKMLSNGQYQIIGIISDFNYESLKKKVEPAMLRLSSDEKNNLTISFSGKHTEELITDLNDLWIKVGAEGAPEYYFLDENFERLVRREKVLSKSVLIFTFFAMFISCLGLYGLSIFTAERRTKEIGIRRVLGASVSSIAGLLSKNFALPILIAFIIAAPVALMVVREWLANYAYRIDLGLFPFLLGGGTALTLGLVTISWQSIKAALKKPTVSLRSE